MLAVPTSCNAVCEYRFLDRLLSICGAHSWRSNSILIKELEVLAGLVIDETSAQDVGLISIGQCLDGFVGVQLSQQSGTAQTALSGAAL
jgi:hypothetical protein